MVDLPAYVVSGVLAVVAGLAVFLAARYLGERAENRERTRLERRILPSGQSDLRAEIEARIRSAAKQGSDWDRKPDQPEPEPDQSDRSQYTDGRPDFPPLATVPPPTPSSTPSLPRPVPPPPMPLLPGPETSSVVDFVGARPQDEENTQFTLLLIDYYAHGLTQARRNSIASLLSAGVGVAAVITGAVIAIFRADTSGGVTASVVVSLAGAITNAIGVLFHRQANRALTHMESQTQNLRQDMRTDRETRKAIQLLDDVADSRLRDRLLAGVVLHLAQAKMPDLPGPTPPSLSITESAGLNDAADHHDASAPSAGPGTTDHRREDVR